MTHPIMTADEQQQLLETYVNSPHVMARSDPTRRMFDDLIAECLRIDELSLGCALMSLVAIRSAGRQDRAAGALLELVASRWMSVPGQGGLSP